MEEVGKMINLHQHNRFIYHVCCWVCIFLLSIAGDSYQYHENFWSVSRMFYFGLTMTTQILTAYFLAYFVIPRLLRTKKYFLVACYFLAGMYVLCVCARIINIYISEPLQGIPPKSYETLGNILTDVKKLFFVYFFRNISVALVFLFIKLLTDQFVMQRWALSLAKEKAESELKHLKAQLNPHFLFNTLNNIYALSVISSPATSQAIARLSNILDYILYRCDKPLVPLSAEMKLLDDYIELEKLRYDEQLEINFNTHVGREIAIAPLLLLSIVENAFKHGAARELENAFINIGVRLDHSVFEFKVVNSVPVEKECTAISNSRGIGLNNLRQQLQLIYGENYALLVEEKEGWFSVTLTLQIASR